MVFEAGVFLLSVGLRHYFQEKAKRYCTPYIIRADRYSPKSESNGIG